MTAPRNGKSTSPSDKAATGASAESKEARKESRQRLIAAQKNLEKLVSTFQEDVARPIADDIGGVVTRDFDDPDLARVLNEREMSENLAILLEQDRAQVEHALERMREGGYGVCEDCAKPIPQERLKFNPAATRCVNCQGNWERVNGRTA